jgi:primase-polymerase (primpol)-like protein
MSYESFEKEMIEADKQFAKHGGRPMDLDAVVENEPLDDQAVFLTTVSQMAAINAFNHLSVYQHEFISPTDVQKSLFAKENDFERKVFISAITDDVPLRKFKKQFPKTKVDDQQAKIFHFRTPKFTWGSYSEERDTLSSSTIRLLR